MKSYNQFIKEEYYGIVRSLFSSFVYEIFLNPSFKEFREIISDSFYRALILDENDIIAFNPNGLHGEVTGKYPEFDDAIPVVIDHMSKTIYVDRYFRNKIGIIEKNRFLNKIYQQEFRVVIE